MDKRKKLKFSITLVIAVFSFPFNATISSSHADPCYTVSGSELTVGTSCTGALDLTGSGVTSIGDSAFFHDTGLTSIVFPAGLLSIGDYAFAGNANLVDPIFPATLLTIGREAFAGGHALRTLTLPKSVNSISYYAFGDTFLTSVSIPDDTSLTSISDYTFGNDPQLASIHLPSSITSVGSHSFDNDPMLTTISIPGVTTIGASAFELSSCPYEVNPSSKIARTFTMSSVITIGVHAFSCNKFAELSLPNTLTSIGSGAFNQATSTSPINLILPDSLVNVGDGGGAAFQQNTAFTSVSVGPNLTSLPGQTFYNNFGYGPTSITFRGSSLLTSFGNGDFFGFNGTTMTLPSSLINFGDQTFSYTQNLKYLVIPDSVTTMGTNDFVSSSVQYISYCGSSNSVINYSDYPAGAYQGCSRGVIFDPNGGIGSMSIESQTVSSISPKALTANSFVKSGFSLVGWNTARDGSGTAYSDGATFSFSSTLLLYAQWATPISISYDTNGGLGSVPIQSALNSGNTFSVASGSGLTKAGYVFGGWSDAYSTYSSGSIYTVGSSAIRLTAIWNPVIPVPDPLQTDSISSISPTQLNVGVNNSMVILGKFDRTISAVDIGTSRLPSSYFKQTPTSVSFTFTPLLSGPTQITIYNGAAPVMSQTVTVATPAPSSPVSTQQLGFSISQSTAKKIARCTSARRSYVPLGKVCLKGYTPVYS